MTRVCMFPFSRRHNRFIKYNEQSCGELNELMRHGSVNTAEATGAETQTRLTQDPVLILLNIPH